MSLARRGFLVVFATFCTGAAAEPPRAPAPEVLASWVALDAPTGHEELAVSVLMSRLPGWERDEHGNLLRRVGSGSPRRIVACGLDWHGFAVSQITESGYLRLHRVGGGTGHPLWDQAHEGQQVRVLTREGPVLGVVGIANAHFGAQHRSETDVVTADDLWLDVGAETAEEVEELSIRLLDPVLRHIPQWSYAREVAGPGAGARLGCAALAAASQGSVVSGETVFLMSVQHVFGWVGLGAAVQDLGRVDELVVLGPGESERVDEIAGDRIPDRLAPVLRHAGVGSVRWLAPAVRDPGALMERVDVSEAGAILEALAKVASVEVASLDWVRAPSPPPPVGTPRPDETGMERRAAELIETLVELPAVSGHEQPVRETVLANMPDWARRSAQVDAIGNLWVEMGPESEATVFVAHMDEVGFEVETIARDGTLTLVRRSAAASAWEGQPARLQLETPDSGLRELSGVFLTRDDPEQKRPAEVRAWFGMDAEELGGLGVRPGLAVTGYKEGHRIGAHRFTSRALDDRAGTSALLMVLRRLDPTALSHRVVFAWSVREESGLDGAVVLAERLGARTRRVFSIDTFVSSDTPLESPHFAYARLGQGPVLRAIENSSLATPAERERTLAIAHASGIGLQVGLTQGGTDGTAFTFWGAPNAGLSWPGRYSHSPAEVLDLRDVVALHELILAMATATE